MIEAIDVVIVNGKIICGFPTRKECKDYMKKEYPGIDPYDVTIQTQYLSPHQPGSRPR